MASTETKISNQAGAGKTRDITFTIPETLEIISKPGSATEYHYRSKQDWIVNHLWYKETQGNNYL